MSSVYTGRVRLPWHRAGCDDRTLYPGICNAVFLFLFHALRTTLELLMLLARTLHVMRSALPCPVTPTLILNAYWKFLDGTPAR
jgi:hypothetical protein